MTGVLSRRNSRLSKSQILRSGSPRLVLPGHQTACTRLMKIARRACLNGNSDWCSIAAQLAAVQEPATPSYPHYDPSPLAPYRGIIQDTNKYINSYCSDPKIAAQLRGFKLLSVVLPTAGRPLHPRRPEAAG